MTTVVRPFSFGLLGGGPLGTEYRPQSIKINVYKVDVVAIIGAVMQTPVNNGAAGGAPSAAAPI